jgi:hypothetical protein
VAEHARAWRSCLNGSGNVIHYKEWLNSHHERLRFSHGPQPAEIFVYIFLPPLLMDTALRLDLHLLKKVSAAWHALFAMRAGIVLEVMC